MLWLHQRSKAGWSFDLEREWLGEERYEYPGGKYGHTEYGCRAIWCHGSWAIGLGFNDWVSVFDLYAFFEKCHFFGIY